MKKRIIKTLTWLIALATCSTSMAQKPDFVRTPNGPNTIVDWNLKAKTLIIPHGSSYTLAGAQDSTGHIRLKVSSDTTLGVYIKGFGWLDLANKRNLPSLNGYAVLNGSNAFIGPQSINYSGGSPALTASSATGTAAAFYGYTYFGNVAGGNNLLDIEKDVQVRAGYKLKTYQAPTDAADVMRLGDMAVYALDAGSLHNTGNEVKQGNLGILGTMTWNNSLFQSTMNGAQWTTPNGNNILLTDLQDGSNTSLGIYSNRYTYFGSRGNSSSNTMYYFRFNGNYLERMNDGKKALFDGDDANFDKVAINGTAVMNGAYNYIGPSGGYVIMRGLADQAGTARNTLVTQDNGFIATDPQLSASGSQLRIGADNFDNPVTKLRVVATNRGVSLPTMTQAQRQAIAVPPDGYSNDIMEGLLVYQKDNVKGLYVNILDGASTPQWYRFVTSGDVGVANGIAGLDGSGKVPLSQLPANLFKYKGLYNPVTNSPTLSDGTGTTGDVYEASVDGSRNLGSGTIVFKQGDFIIYNGTKWEFSGATNRVTSVNGQQGIVALTTDDVAEGGGNQYWTTARTNALYPQLTSAYTNPAWISSLSWSKITGTPTTRDGYGITDVYIKTESDARYEVPLTFSTGLLTRSGNVISTNQAATPTWTGQHVFQSATSGLGPIIQTTSSTSGDYAAISFGVTSASITANVKGALGFVRTGSAGVGKFVFYLSTSGSAGTPWNSTTDGVAELSSSGFVLNSGTFRAATLTAGLPVFTDPTTKNFITNPITGTGSVVMSASPNLTGTAGLVNATLTGTLTTAGHVATPSSVKTANYTTLLAEEIIPCNSTTAGFNVTLLSTAAAGQIYTIDNGAATANAVTVVGTINGVTNYSLAFGKSVTLYKTAAGTNTWRIIGTY